MVRMGAEAPRAGRAGRGGSFKSAGGCSGKALQSRCHYSALHLIALKDVCKKL